MKKVLTIVCAVAALTIAGCKNNNGAGGTGNESGETTGSSTNNAISTNNAGGTGNQSGTSSGGASTLGTNNAAPGHTNGNNSSNP